MKITRSITLSALGCDCSGLRAVTGGSSVRLHNQPEGFRPDYTQLLVKESGVT